MIVWGSGIIERYREKGNYSQFILFLFLTIKIIQRAVDAKYLTVHNDRCINTGGVEIKKNLDTICLWENYYSKLTVNPFEFLDFVKKKDLFRIPPELEFVKRTSESGKMEYHWVSDVQEDSSKQQEINKKVESETLGPGSDEINNLSEMSGKEKQELGRLRAEKFTMDSTVKSAINVDKYIEKAKIEGRQIVKSEICDLINGIDLKIPNTRIDLIWKSIPDDIKSGPGRPKKKNNI